MTIGYGVPDPYFNDCDEVIFLLSTQSLWSLLLDAMLLNLVYQRFSRAFERALAMVFSDVCIVTSTAAGGVQLVFRICEMRKQPLLEPLVRVYCVRHVEDEFEPGAFQVDVQPVALEEPDNSIADGKIFLSLPVRVVHAIGPGSPLAPPAQEGKAGVAQDLSAEDVQVYLQSLPFVEIIAIVSGTDGVTGNSIEARHSYTMEEIRWNCRFVRCVSWDNGMHCVDFSELHRTARLP
eukprot:CAMPEP_0177514548 /NCGR_PEP_ID=MMETSP0369-20130122/44379_1 /TAXON_ID=447022 ORGANISM="Scrippsiella hangoei-like, Strain SHHI-4" /NCGR_SAMPLE_ID=MMETSP0369 /ASSEMBLY_ACC=CAM_ASM_000364 /LENGTH=234 /DNA_ID=CAMNT_0018993253 /DNA_START=306 /DNA_END=1007 /DNA_ORIENTATION=+